MAREAAEKEAKTQASTTSAPLKAPDSTNKRPKQMSGFKEPSLAERQSASIKAKSAALENFRVKAAGPAKKKMAKQKTKAKQATKTKKRTT